MKCKLLLALLLSLAMLLAMMPFVAMAYYEESIVDGASVDVCTEGKTYSLFTEDNLEEQNGTTFLYVVKRNGRYYTPGNPRYSKFEEVDYVSAIDITEYYDEKTNTFSGFSNNLNLGVMQYQMSAGSYMYVDGNMLFALSVPFESCGKEWFDGGIRYYSPNETYSYSRPLWHANGDGSGYFYDSYIDWISDSDEWIYGVLDLKHTGTNYVFALRDKSAEYTEARNADPDNYDIGVNVKAYLYAAPCGHEQNVHGNADEPNCMEKGCKEYWYCRLCDKYFSNEEMTTEYEGFPEIDALGHDWNGEKCNNCNRPVPVYSKVTNKTDFLALADDTMYVLVAEYEGKYYTPDSSILYSYVFDLDGDGYVDIYNVDENNNGTPDVAEIDWDENGVYDLWEYQTEEERREYFDSICHGYLVDMLYGQTVGIPVKEITLNPDGTISHDAAKDALEFEMVKLHSEEDNPDYTLECVMQFVVPNTFINSPAFIPEDRPYDKQYPDEGDTYYWAVLFYNDRDSYYTYDWENDEYVDGLPFLDICKEGSIALSKANSMFSPEFEEQLGCLRLRDYNGELRFVVGADYALEGSEWIDDENGGYYDTNDTQACVYLYASVQYDSHTCDFSYWTDNGDGTHIRTCKDPDCTKTEIASHGWNGGTETIAPGCTEDGVKIYTCADCQATRTETLAKLGHNFGAWSENGENHSRSCSRDGCAASESDPHEFTAWVDNGDAGHGRSCTVCLAERNDEHSFDDGVITTPPTEEAEGVKTYTCQVCMHQKTESIDKLEHVHSWSDWVYDDENTHSKSCACGESQTAEHSFDDGEVIQAPTHTEVGQIKYTCEDCFYEKYVDMPVVPDHQWSDWTALDGSSHTRECVCGEIETDNHNFDDGEITKEPTEQEEGVLTYTCESCKYEKTEIIDKETHIHSWSEWKETGNGTHARYCNCGESETDEHSFDGGRVVKESTHLEQGLKIYTCTVCDAIREETLDKTDEHTFVNGKCECGEEDPNYVPPHEHNFVNGKCECGEEDPSYVSPHEHTFVNGKCECGEEDPSYVPPHEHTFVNGRCECGEEDPGYVPPHEHNFVNGRCECGEEDPSYVPPHEHKFGDWICEATVVGKHYRECECGEREFGDCTWDNGVVTLAPTFDATGEKTYTCTACGGTRKEELPRCMTEIENGVVGVVVGVPEGGEAYLPAGTTVDVTEVSSDFISSEAVDQIGDTFEGIASPIACYDISLLLEGNQIQPDGSVIVTLPAPHFEEVYTDVVVVYIAPDGEVEECKTTVNDDGSISFETDHFSRYAIIGITEESKLGGGAIACIIIGAVVLICGAVCVYLFVIKKKTSVTFDEENNAQTEENQTEEQTEKNQTEEEHTEKNQADEEAE